MTWVVRRSGLLSLVPASALGVALGCVPDSPQLDPAAATHLFVWASDADQQDSDFLAVIDARLSEPTYGQVVATLPVGAAGTLAHHTEYEYPTNDTLFANGWSVGRVFLVDVSDPRAPRMAGEMGDAAGYRYPHSFVRLENGHVLATFQAKGERYAPPGALVELDASGRVVRTASARTPDLDSALTWPYSLAVVLSADRVVTTSSEMGFPPFGEWKYHDTYHVQIWRLSDLAVLATVPLPTADDGPHHLYPSEPRALADGTVYVVTFNCGLYRLDGLTGEKPTAHLVHKFPGGPGTECGVPAVYGKYWIQTAPEVGLVVLDVRDPEAPVEVSRLALPEHYHMPHWLAADRAGGRLVLTGMDGTWVLVLKLDDRTGALAIDETFRDGGAAHPGVSFDRARWPHGETGGAIVHGALFGK